MSRLQYELRVDDLRKWLALPPVQNPGHRRRLRLIRFGGAAAVVAICALLTRAMASPLFLLYGLAGGLAFALLTLPLTSAGHDLLASASAALGLHEVSLSEDGVVHQPPGARRATLRWAEIDRVDALGDLTLISTRDAPALVIPRASMTDAIYDAFIAELRQRWHAHSASPL